VPRRLIGGELGVLARPSHGRARRPSLHCALRRGGFDPTAADDYVGDVFIDNGTVSLLGESLDVSADKVIDAAGKYVLPGAIDPHTHLEMFFGGTTTCDDFTSGTVSAAFGAAAESAAEVIDPMEDAQTSAEYRRDLARTVMRRALEQSAP